MVNEINNTTFISESIVYIRNILRENITDPLADVDLSLSVGSVDAISPDVTGNYTASGTSAGSPFYNHNNNSNLTLKYAQDLTGSRWSVFVSGISTFRTDNLGSRLGTYPGFIGTGSVTVSLGPRVSGKFVMTSYPRESGLQYPIITVRDAGTSTIRNLGMQSEQSAMNLPFEIRVWGRNEKEKDTISQNVYNFLQGNQFGTGSTTRNAGMHDFVCTSMINIDENGEEGTKSKIMEYRYLYINQ